MKPLIYNLLFAFPSLLSFLFFLILCYYFWNENTYFIFKENTLSYTKTGDKSIPLPEDWISYRELPENIKKEFIQSLDKKYYYQHGYSHLNLAGILFYKMGIISKPSFYDTISLKLVKILFPIESNPFSLSYIQMSVALEKSLNKNELLEYYINLAEWKEGKIGILAASKFYFQKHPKELTNEEVFQLTQLLNE